jgi:hypothetical protein
MTPGVPVAWHLKTLDTNNEVANPYVGESRRWLIDGLRRHLIPAFEKVGFEVVPLMGDEASSREFRTAFPYGRLQRASQAGIEMVEIQLDKHGDAAFRINAGVAPAGGIHHPLVGHIEQEKLRVHDLSRHFEAYGWPLLRRWFSVRRAWFGSSPTKVDYENLVAGNLGLVQEVEDVFRHGRLGPHIRKVEA